MARSRVVPRVRPQPPDTIERHERWLVPLLLALHVGAAVWVAGANSVTFDENLHVPAGVRIVRAGDFASSYAQPPLPKTLYALAALAAGAREPDPASASPGAERDVGYSFMRRNADRYQRVYVAARLVAVAASAALGCLVWRTARAWSGPRGGILALALWAALPDVLALAGLAGVDLPTGLTCFGAVLAWLAFVRTGRWTSFVACAAWTSAAFLTRFSAVQLFPMFAVIAVAARWLGHVRRPARVWCGFALLPVVALIALAAGYAFQVSFAPLSMIAWQSTAFRELARTLPGLRLPLPDAWLMGTDYVSSLAQAGGKASYLLGQVRHQHDLWYFPIAIAAKWPLGLIALALWRTIASFRRRTIARARVREVALVVPMAVTLAVGMTSNLDYGVRYIFPMLPFLCVWLSRLASSRAPGVASRAPVSVALALVAAVALESMFSLPYPLAFFNRAVGGPGRGDRIVNDSNVDWGQGLIALRDELHRRGIGRVHLLYHGTADPALYGIDYSLYTGGEPGPESDWLAVSSFFLVGLTMNLTTSQGMSQQNVGVDMGELRTRAPVARPAGSIYLFRIR